MIGREASEEVRFAVVLNGGVSLAVWMGGAVLELDAVTRGDGTYGELLPLFGISARADVIAYGVRLFAPAFAGRSESDARAAAERMSALLMATADGIAVNAATTAEAPPWPTNTASSATSPSSSIEARLRRRCAGAARPRR